MYVCVSHYVSLPTEHLIWATLEQEILMQKMVSETDSTYDTNAQCSAATSNMQKGK